MAKIGDYPEFDGMVDDALEICRGAKVRQAVKDVLVGLCYAVADTVESKMQSNPSSDELHEGCGGVLEMHCDTDITAAGVMREYWQQCSKCHQIFDPNEPKDAPLPPVQ